MCVCVCVCEFGWLEMLSFEVNNLGERCDRREDTAPSVAHAAIAADISRLAKAKGCAKNQMAASLKTHRRSSEMVFRYYIFLENKDVVLVLSVGFRGDSHVSLHMSSVVAPFARE